MANSVPMTTREAIRALRKRGYSRRKIARELGVHRNTVGNYLDLEDGGGVSKCTTPSPGSEESGGRARSACEAYREIVEGKLEAGLDGKRIWQDLVDEHGFGHGYQSVKRFVGKLRARAPRRVWRMECEPGERPRWTTGRCGRT